MKIRYADNSTRMYYAGGLTNLIWPQLIFIEPSDMLNYSRALETNDEIRESSNLIYRAVSLYNGEKMEIDDLIRGAIINSDYKCVVCGMDYDSGMPTSELVARHILWNHS